MPTWALSSNSTSQITSNLSLESHQKKKSINCSLSCPPASKGNTSVIDLPTDSLEYIQTQLIMNCKSSVIFLLQDLHFDLAVIVILCWRRDLWALLRTVLGATFWALWAFFSEFMCRRRLFLRSIAVVELISFFFLLLVLFERIDSSCYCELLANPVSLFLSLFETVRRIYLIVCIALELQVL